MSTYLINEDTRQIIIDEGNLGPVFYAPPWREATQAEINNYILSENKKNKINELNTKFIGWVNAGFLFDADLFDLSDSGVDNVRLKNELPLTAPDRFKYFTLPDEQGVEIQHDFADEAGWILFFDEIILERDRIMIYKNSKRTEINSAQKPAEVVAITINFST